MKVLIILFMFLVGSIAYSGNWKGSGKTTHMSKAACESVEGLNMCLDAGVFVPNYHDLDGDGNPVLNPGKKAAFETAQAAKDSALQKVVNAKARIKGLDCDTELGVVKDMCIVLQRE